MYIAVAADGINLISKVDDLASCKYLLTVNMDNMDVNAIENSGDPQGEALAHKVVDNNWELSCKVNTFAHPQNAKKPRYRCQP
jgi:hypothetical protein